MVRYIRVMSLALLLVGCVDLDKKSFSSSHFYQQRNLIFEENVEFLSERVKEVLAQDNWKITYDGIDQPGQTYSGYNYVNYVADEKPVGMDATAWHYTMYSTDIPYEFIQARKLTSYGVYAYIVVSKQFDQKSSLAITVSAESPDKKQLITKYNKSFVNRMREPLIEEEEKSTSFWRFFTKWFD
jgi:hypothetical protein